MQTAHAAQYPEKSKQSSQKMSRRPKQTFLQRRHTDGEQRHEKMLNIINYQGNVNQNYSESELSITQQSELPLLKNPQTINGGEGAEKREASYTGEKVYWCSYHGETMEDP